MAGRGDIQAGKASIEIYVKNSALVKGLREAQKSLQGLGSGIATIGAGLAGMGAAIVTPIAGAIAQFVSFGSTLNDMSARTGVAASSLAELKFAAEQNGASLEDVEIGLKKMVKAGYSVRSLDAVAVSISSIKDPSERAAKAMEIFGKSGTMLLPMLANLKALRAEAQASGLVPTDEAVGMADALGDAFDKVRAQAMSALFEIGAAVGPALMPALKLISSIATVAIRWVRENQGIIRTVAMIGAGLLVAGTAITAIGAAVFGVGAALGIVAATITAVTAFLASPLGIVLMIGGAVAGLVAAWVRFTASGQAAANVVMAKFTELLAFAQTVGGGIANALMAGNVGLAAEVAMAGVRLAFENGKLAIIVAWEGLKLRILAMMDEIRVAFAPVIAFMGSLWNTFCLAAGIMFSVAFGQTIGDTWKAFKLAGSMAITVIMEMLNQLLSMFKILFNVAAIGFNDILKKAATIANVAIPVINTGSTKFSGFDVGAAITTARKAADDAGVSGREDADKRQAERRADSDDRVGVARSGVDAARADLDAAVAAAKAAREAAEAGASKKLAPGLPDAAELKQKVAVGFSGAGLVANLQGGGSPQERIAKAAEAALKKDDLQIGLLTQIKDKAGGFAWGA